MNFIGIIPARYYSTRFPGKPLAMINGKSMIQRVYEQAKKTNALSYVIVATDDKRIEKHIKTFNGNVMLTSGLHKSGTERCNEVIEKLENISFEKRWDVVINIQGDEPYINPAQIQKLSSCFKNNKNVQIATLIKKINSKKELLNPNVVKVVIDKNKQAIYFSRSVIPYLRVNKQGDNPKNYVYFKHIGIYGYKTEILKTITKLKPTPLEKAESLEQLRWIENGFKIYTELTDFESHAIDTPEDLSEFINKA